ncbi:unnamed protein product [Penicillium camemberti]|uniref:Str. FM013 n=1 Tax=Penicillium camemberti (strain FM 013) TaxID=1429867 RepID=A0A0G4PQ81_PENC3|nr:unnamed protein product [Penicillium camemberti]
MPWDDWRAELNQPSGDDIGSRRCADMQFSRSNSIPLVRILNRVDEQTNNKPRSNVILPELVPSEVKSWTKEPA